MMFLRFFFFNDTATTEIYTLSLHDALPIWSSRRATKPRTRALGWSSHGASSTTSSTGRDPAARLSRPRTAAETSRRDRKSTRLNSSHANISYAVFCLKKKKTHATELQSHHY